LRKIGGSEFRLKYVNIVFQSYNLIKYMTARENVQVAIDFDKRKVNPDKYLDQVGLTEEEDGRLVNKLSGGQQQRVAIARAIASNSPIIVADEPTGNLDEETEEKIIDIFRELAHEQNKIVIIVTHSKRVAEHADKVLRLRRGKLS
jgi:putative ABC transport system ATP-binding protein